MNVPSKDKFLYFNDSAEANNGFAAPASELRYIDQTGANTAALKFMNPATISGGSPQVQVTVNVTDFKTFCEDMANEMAFGNSTFVVVADDANSVTLNSNVTSMGGIELDFTA